MIINNKEVPDPALDALVAMGQPAVDYLGRQLSTRTLLNLPFYCRAYTNLPVSIRRLFPNPFMDETKQLDAAMALISFGTKAHKEVPAIIDVIISKPGHIMPMLGALTYLDAPRSELERLLTALVQHGRYDEARDALRDLDLRSPLAAMHIAEMLAKGDPSDGEYKWYFERLGEIGSNAAVAVPTLLRTITSTNLRVRYQTVSTLREIGPAAVEALPALQACLNDHSPMMQAAARRAIDVIAATNSASHDNP